MNHQAVKDCLDQIEARTNTSAILLTEPLNYRAYVLGYRNAQLACEAAIVDLEQRLANAQAEADRWYERAHHKGRRALSEIRQRRITQAMSDAFDDERLLSILDEVDVAVTAAAAPSRAA